ncbi:hypothetical protein GGI42DRAFT_323480 [Trichoderma sp. SZMC 28013]
MFDKPSAYHRAKNANLLTNEVIQQLYRITKKEILTNMYFEPVLACKCTIKKPWAQGSVGERDTLGTQTCAVTANRRPCVKRRLHQQKFGRYKLGRKSVREYHLHGVAHVGSGPNHSLCRSPRALGRYGYAILGTGFSLASRRIRLASSTIFLQNWHLGSEVNCIVRSCGCSDSCNTQPSAASSG